MIAPSGVKAKAAGVLETGLVVSGKRIRGVVPLLATVAFAVGGCSAFPAPSPTPNPGEGYKTSIVITETVNVFPVVGGVQRAITCYTNFPVDIEITPAANYETRINGTVHCPIVDDHSQDVRNAMGLTGNSADAPKLDITTPDKPVITPLNSSSPASS